MNTVAPEPKSRPAEWYQVTYNLAAQKAHLALEPELGREKRLLPFLRTLLQDAESARQRRQLLLQAHAHAEKLLRRTVADLFADDRVAEGKGQPPATGRLDAKFRSFLEETVEPTGAVLLAGLTKAADLDFDERGAITTRQDLLEAMRAGTPSPDELLGYVTERRELAFRVRYNLACYYAGESPRLAFEQLRMALTSAPRLEATVLADWAKRDPSLERLRSAMRDEFDRFVRLYSLPAIEEETSVGSPQSSAGGRSPRRRRSIEEPTGSEETQEAEEREEPEEPRTTPA